MKRILLSLLLLATVFQTKTYNHAAHVSKEDIVASSILIGVAAVALPIGIKACGDHLRNIDYSPIAEAIQNKSLEVTGFLNAPVDVNNGQLIIGAACLGCLVFLLQEDLRFYMNYYKDKLYNVEVELKKLQSEFYDKMGYWPSN